ncbi:hypothetical protein EMIHUDRAFT_251156 [Emiliania huxleyi CCMP1516]|uniref:Uncharacterized protein n=2 Tax=Emiliania huxleyi TaxID=2903 RepID=A0A0D3KXF8_EMIH1|nr:hypothetical protein EMIHUDRAFT_251156 [Emiliania huxleyi CCMP1516]EOD40443.1 hypothetical protein EMIHUDRAFT_251156 [Emiliania huxleyi CCMP1516]|eukprot:XP_005792872.1 hypothetical protein EMIHUDRAFT_251156 [Emiliania huxleyi CCMP1516]
MRAVASSLSWILCTAPVAASATTCKFLVTPAPSASYFVPVLHPAPYTRYTASGYDFLPKIKRIKTGIR